MKTQIILSLFIVMTVFYLACNKKEVTTSVPAIADSFKKSSPVAQVKTSSVDTVTGTVNFYIAYQGINNDSICSYSFYVNNVTVDSFIIIGGRKIIEPCVADTLNINFGAVRNDSGVYYGFNNLDGQNLTVRMVKDSIYVDWDMEAVLSCVCDVGENIGHFAGKLKSPR